MNMKILNIIEPKIYDSNFIQALLSKKIINDVLFDKIFFSIVIQPEEENYMDYVYRRLWESAYIKCGESVYDSDTDRIILTVSLSEVIGFIYKATPPIMKDRIKDSITSLESINSLLRQFLMDHNGGHLITYLSIFKNHIHFEPFETAWDYDTTGISVMREHNAVGLIASVIHASLPFSQLINVSESDELNPTGECTTNIQLMFHSETPNQTKRLCTILNGTNRFAVNNIKYEGNNLYIMAHGLYITLHKPLREFLRSSYGDIIK